MSRSIPLSQLPSDATTVPRIVLPFKALALHRIAELREFAHRGAKAVAVDVELLDAALGGAKR